MKGMIRGLSVMVVMLFSIAAHAQHDAIIKFECLMDEIITKAGSGSCNNCSTISESEFCFTGIRARKNGKYIYLEAPVRVKKNGQRITLTGLNDSFGFGLKETGLRKTQLYDIVKSCRESGSLNTDVSDVALDFDGTTLRTTVTEDGTDVFGEVDLSDLRSDPNLDNDPINEIQELERTDDVISLTDGGTVDLSDLRSPDNLDNSPTNEIQTITELDGTVTLSNGGGSFDLPEGINNITSFSTVSATYDLLSFPFAAPQNVPADPIAGNTIIERYSNGLGYFTYNGTTWDLNLFETDEDQRFTCSDQRGQDYVEGSLSGPQAPPANPSQADTHLESYDNAIVIFNYQEFGAGAGFDGNNICYIPLPESLDNDITNEIQTISFLGNTVTLSNGGGSFTITDLVDDADADPNNEIQTISTDGVAGNISISDGASLNINVDDADSDATNEIQTISRTDDVLILTDGGPGIDLADLRSPANLDNDPANEIQNVISSDLTVDIVRTENDFDISVDIPASIDVGAFSAAFEESDSTLVFNHVSSTGLLRVGIIDATRFYSPENLDNDEQNELQVINRNGDNIILSNGGGTIDIGDLRSPANLDNDSNNELQTISEIDGTVTLSDGGGSFDLTEVEITDAVTSSSTPERAINNQFEVVINGTSTRLCEGYENVYIVKESPDDSGFGEFDNMIRGVVQNGKDLEIRGACEHYAVQAASGQNNNQFVLLDAVGLLGLQTFPAAIVNNPSDCRDMMVMSVTRVQWEVDQRTGSELQLRALREIDGGGFATVLSVTLINLSGANYRDRNLT